jgi:PPM family protein phosphatase
MSTVIAAAVTHVGNVREQNEDDHLIDPDAQVFAVADGMGGHAAGEIASGAAVRLVAEAWTGPPMRGRVRAYAERGDLDSRRALVQAVREGVMHAHLSIVEEATIDPLKSGMGTTFTGFLVAGGDAVFAHAGDSRAYLVRDGIAMQLSEDHTLLARLAASGIEPSDAAHGGPASRWKGVLTNALGIGDATRVSAFMVPLYSGDRILLCSDGVHDYLREVEIGQVLLEQPSPARAAQKLIDLALDRGGEDNATAVVIKVVEAGETRVPPEQHRRDQEALAACPLLAPLSPQERLRALRITTGREHEAGHELAPVALGERVAYVLLEGEVDSAGERVTAGALIYPEGLIAGTAMPERDERAQAATAVRLLTIRRDDFFEITEEDSDLGVKMYAVLATLMAR